MHGEGHPHPNELNGVRDDAAACHGPQQIADHRGREQEAVEGLVVSFVGLKAEERPHESVEIEIERQ